MCWAGARVQAQAKSTTPSRPETLGADAPAWAQKAKALRTRVHVNRAPKISPNSWVIRRSLISSLPLLTLVARALLTVQSPRAEAGRAVSFVQGSRSGRTLGVLPSPLCPCGEGLGVGVRQRITARPPPRRFAPTLPTRGRVEPSPARVLRRRRSSAGPNDARIAVIRMIVVSPRSQADPRSASGRPFTYAAHVAKGFARKLRALREMRSASAQREGAR